MERGEKNLLRAFVLGAVILAAFGWWAYQNSPRMTAEKQANQRKFEAELAGQTAPPATPPPETKAWREIMRRRATPPEFDVSDPWVGYGPQEVPAGFHAKLFGSFAGSEPGITLVVLDAQNWQRLQAHYPPLPIYSSTGRVACSPPSEFYYLFFRTPADTGSMPNTISGVLIYLLRKDVERQRPPARVSSELEIAFEAFTTPSEAATIHQQLQLAASPVQ